MFSDVEKFKHAQGGRLHEKILSMKFLAMFTVVSEKKGNFICELIVERYIYLRNTQKQLKITHYV